MIIESLLDTDLYKLTMQEVSQFAKINRVERVMQPYLEAIVA